MPRTEGTEFAEVREWEDGQVATYNARRPTAKEDEGMGMTKRILVVDDDKAVNGCFFAALDGEGMKVDCAFTGMDAMELVEQFEYDLIVLDYRLPDINGETFLREVALSRKTKVMLVTGHLTLAMVRVMFKLGICGYLAKPVGRDELVYNVQFHLSSTKASAYTK